MTHNLWVQNNVISKFITSAAFDLGDIGRFQTTSATLGQKSGRWNIGCFSPNIGHFGPNIGRFDSTSAALTSATFDQTSAALTQHRPLSTVPELVAKSRKIKDFIRVRFIVKVQIKLCQNRWWAAHLYQWKSIFSRLILVFCPISGIFLIERNSRFSTYYCIT